MRFRQVILVPLAAAVLLPVAASAQTDTSLRIRSLSTVFSGILDDFLTDVYLDPARVSELERPTAYMVALPSRTIEPPYPVARAYLYSTEWDETIYMKYTIRPIGVSYFGTIGRRTAFSVAAEIGVEEDESMDGYYDLRPSTDNIRIHEDRGGSVTDNQHYLVDLTVGSGGGDTALGGRVRAAYDRSGPGSASYYGHTDWDPTGSDQMYINYDVGYQQNKYERSSLEVALGLYRPGSFVRELVVTGGAARETLSSDSRAESVYRRETAEYLLSSQEERTVYGSDRDYDAYSVSARAHLGWREQVRSTHAFSWAHSTGDGVGELRSEVEDHASISTASSLGSEYAYDGTVDAVHVESTIGYFNNLFDNMLFAFAVFGTYSRSSFDEVAPGDASLRLYDSGLGLDSTFTSPYRNRHKRTVDGFRLSIPVGVEWAFHKYAKLRIGVTVTATRVEDDRTGERTIAELTGNLDWIGATLDTRDLSVDSGIETLFSNGVEININDRLVVDLLSQYTSELYLLRYGYASVRYRF